MSEANNKYPLIIESKSNYAYVLKRKKQLSFNAIRNASNVFYNQLPIEIRNELHQQILRGTCQLDNETELNAYMHDMSLMHNAKLRDAFSHLSTNLFDEKEIDIIDYGCGQAMGCISYADCLRENNRTQNIRRITLIEPSEIALARAALHSSLLFPNAEIVTINKGFDDLIASDIEVDSNIPTLHIFSNVLDMGSTPNYNGVFNLGTFSNLVLEISKGYNEYVITEPLFSDPYRDEQTDIFISSLLGINVYYEKKCNSGEFVANKNWTCVIKCGRIGCYDSNTSEQDKDSWSLTEFRDLHGSLHVLTYANYNELVKEVAFYDEADGLDMSNYTYAKFSKLHGSLSIQTIIKNKDYVTIYQRKNKRGEKYYELELRCNDGISLTEFIKVYGKTRLGKLEEKNHTQCESPVVYISESNEINDLFLRHRNLYKELFADTIRKNSDKIKVYQRVDSNGDKFFELVFNINFVPDNEIWYETVDNQKLNFIKSQSEYFGVNIISNTYYKNGIGILKFEDPIKFIDNCAFSYKNNLSRVYLPNGVVEIGGEEYSWAGVFSGCTELLSITLPNTLCKIGKRAFYGCSKLKLINIPQNIESIGDGAFGKCCNLKTFSGKFAKDNGRCLIINGVLCSFAIGCGLKEYTIPSEVSVIGSSAFNGCDSLKCIHIHNQITQIKANAFRDCSNLKNINIPNSVTRIDYGTFEGCSNLKYVDIPDTITSIEQHAFENCRSLVEVFIPDSVASIGEEAFKNCENLSEVCIGQGVESISNSVFIGCHRLKLFKGKYVSEDGRSLIFDNKLISFAPYGITQYNIPHNVREICWSVFSDCKQLNYITIPDSVITIKQSAFLGCDNLHSIIIPNGVKELIPCAIGDINVVYCKSIIPPTAIEHCLKCSNNPTMKRIDFDDVSKVIYVPYQSYDLYINDSLWKQFHNRLQPYDYENNMVYQRH